MASTPKRESEIFNSALERTSPAERAAFLDGACGEDADLRARVGALLSAHELAGGFLPMDNPTAQPSPFAETIGKSFGGLPVSEKPGDRIGRYKLREKIGEGGGGAVYVAEQEQPVRRRVALKVIKLGMDTKSVIARFEAERQALAMMDHPNIAKVLDAGATETGRPYFVMELVRGTKITYYCDQKKLGTRDRLDLFIKVCQAIQHAHQKGIIHRDVKPSNILVTLHDGVPVPKIIDFGIAKATEGRLTDLTVYTDLHHFIGTPAYMSPEQAEMSGLDIDTRADIYSLGVLLYELLTGETPFNAKDLQQSGLDAMRKTICETEPLRPSTRLSTMVDADLTSVAHRHGDEPPRLVRLIRGDLDWIVMKALEKDRTRRYETANGLAMDIQRHLNNEPIVARPQSFAYRFQKLARRNKLAFAAAGAVVVALLFGLAGILWQWRQAERNHQEAEANLYAADLNRAAQVLDDLGPLAARRLLERHVGQTQLHGFEWRYLWQRCLGDFDYSYPSHGNRIWKLAFSPDGKTLAALEEGGVLRLLNVNTRTETVCLTNATGLAGFTADGKELILMLRAEKAERLARYSPTSGHVADLAPAENRLGWLPDLLADGHTAVVPENKTEFSLVDTRSGTVRKQLPLPDVGILRWQAFAEACVVSDDGQWVFSLENGSQYSTVGILSIHDVATGRLLATYKDDAAGTPKTVLTDRVYVLRFLPGGKTVLWASRDGYVHRWNWTDPSSLPVAEHGHRGIVWDIVCSPDGSQFATAGDDETVRLWDAKDLTELRVLRGHDDPVYSAAFSPDGHLLASGGEGGSVKLWDLDRVGSSGQVPLIAARQLANRILFSRDGSSVAVGTDDDGVSVINNETKEVTAVFKDLLFPARFAPEGMRLYCLGGIGNLATAMVEQTNDLSLVAYPWCQDVSPDGALMLRSFRSTPGRGDAAELYDIQHGSVVSKLACSSFVTAAQFAPDGRTILTADGGGNLTWWRVGARELGVQRTIQIGHFSRAMAISPDANTVALGGMSRISLVDFRSGVIRQRLFGHSHEINGLAFSPDGSTLASCSMDGTIKLWNLRTMQEVCTITFDVKPALGKEIGVQAIAFAPDGNSLWACSRSGALKYWRAATLEDIAAAEQAAKP